MFSVLRLCVVFFLLMTVTIQAQTVNTQDEKIAAEITRVVQLVTANPSDESALSEAKGLGFALIRAGRYGQARQVFNSIIKAVPRDKLVLYGIALSAFNLRLLDEAEKAALTAAAEIAALLKEKKEIENISPDDRKDAADVLVLLAVIVAVKGNNASALGYLKQAVVYDPANFDAQFSLGRAFYSAGDADGAIKAFRQAIALQPKNERALFFLATTLESAGNEQGALTAYRDLLSKIPNSADGNLGLGVLLLKLEGHKSVEGQAALRRAISINPNLYEARVVLGRTLLRLNKAEEAVVQLTRAAELMPNNPEPHYQLALAYRKLGRKEDSEKEFAIVKKIHESRRGETNNNN